MNNTQLFHYRIHEKLGQGGMGEVYAATDTKLSREVAVKILPESVANPEIKRRFLQEAQLSARLNHPAITQVYDLEEHSPSTPAPARKIRPIHYKDPGNSVDPNESSRDHGGGGAILLAPL